MIARGIRERGRQQPVAATDRAELRRDAAPELGAQLARIREREPERVLRGRDREPRIRQEASGQAELVVTDDPLERCFEIAAEPLVLRARRERRGPRGRDRIDGTAVIRGASFAFAGAIGPLPTAPSIAMICF